MVSKIIYGYEAKPKKIVLDQVYKVTINDLKKTFPNTKIIIQNKSFKFLSKIFFVILI